MLEIRIPIGFFLNPVFFKWFDQTHKSHFRMIVTVQWDSLLEFFEGRILIAPYHSKSPDEKEQFSKSKK